MIASVHSSFWYRAAALRPAVAAHVRVARHQVRGQLWYVFTDVRDGSSLRLDRAAYALIGRCDGSVALQQLWERVCERLGDAAPTQDEAIRLLSRLHARGLLRCGDGEDADAVFRHWQQDAKGRARAGRNPLAWRVELGDPGALLSMLGPLARTLFSPAGLVAWVACVAAGALAGAMHAELLVAHGARWLGTPEYLLLAALAYPPMKAVHELAHALAVRAWGGRVHRWGVTFLLLVPVPYVDASAADAFRRHRRVIVSAAGIMAESFVAVAGLAVFLLADPGTLRDTGYVVAFIGSVSTVLFNANPLMRFDGYYVLTDALALPNLASRSGQYWRERLWRMTSGRAPSQPLVPASGERGWLLGYAPLAWVYRVAISIAIVGWVGSWSFVLGAATAVLLAATLIGAPALALGRHLASPAEPLAARLRAGGCALAAAAVVAGLVGGVPLPHATRAQGVVRVPEQAQLRPSADGFVDAVLAADGARVRTGDPILRLRNPALLAERERAGARIAALEAEVYRALGRERARAAEAQARIARARAELARVDERIAGLDVRAQVDGRLVLPRSGDLAGRHVREGERLGHVLPDGDATVRVALREADAAALQAGVRSASARFPDAPGETVPATLAHDLHAASERLPAAALSTRNGGTHLTDPQDAAHVRAIDPVVAVDVRVPATAAHGRIGQRAWVRFDHGEATLARRWLLGARQALVDRFAPRS